MADEAKRGVAQAHIGMMLWAVIVGMSFPVVGLISDGLPPLLLTTVRFAIAALVLVPLLWRVPGGWPGGRELLMYAVMGLCLAGFFSAMFWAAHSVTAISMATLRISVPLMSYALGRIGGVESRAFRLACILVLGAIGALGLVWAEAGGDFQTLHFGLGELGFLGGCIASALFPVATKWGLKRKLLSEHAVVRTFWSLVSGGVLIGLPGLLVESPQALATASLTDILVVMYLSVLSSASTFWLLQRATVVLTPGVVTAYSYVTPFVSMLLLFIAQPQTLSWQWLPGSVLVVTATALLLHRNIVTRRSAEPSAS